MKKQTLFMAFLIGIAILFSLSGFQKEKTTTTMSKFNNDPYKAAWRTVDSLDQQGLPKSALEKVEEIYALAKKDNNPTQLVKTILYKGKYTNTLEEDGLVNAINNMRVEMEASEFPVKPLLQSMIGEMYMRYMENHRWQMQNRTEVINFELEDIRTWSMKQFIEESAQLYRASLSDNKIKDTRLESFALLTHKGHRSEKLRTTLYDILAFRAIKHFSNNRSYLTEPVYKFYINQDEVFGDVNTFINYQFETKDSTSKKYHTLLLFQDVLQFHQNDDDPAALIDADLIRLEFAKNHAVQENKDDLYYKALESLREQHKTHPSSAEVMHKMALWHFEKGNQYIPNPDDTNKWQKQKAMALCEEAIKQFPEAYGADLCMSLKYSMLRKHLHISTEEVNLRKEDFLALVRYKNVKKAYFKVIKIDEGDKKKINRKSREEILSFLYGKSVIKSWSHDLPDDGDYNEHSVEVKIDALPTGQYGILISDNEQYTDKDHSVCYLFTRVSNIAYLQKNLRDGQATMVVVDRKTGEPLEGVKAEFFKQKYNSNTRNNEFKSAGSSLSDKNGFVNPSVGTRDYYRVKFSKGDDYLFLDQGFHTQRNRDNNKGYRVTHFFLDRAIYRPGQTVYFKALVLNKDKEGIPTIADNQAVVITLKDANYQEVEKLDLRTNEFGTVQGSFTAPMGGLLGSMSLQSSISGNISFRVEEYKRPKFEVTFEPIKAAYKLGEEVSVKGLAKAFAGSNIDGAKVSYRVERSATYPNLPWYYRSWLRSYYRHRGGHNTNAMQITVGETTTNENGEFEIKFKALADPSISKKRKPVFTYKVFADVTDITGESHSNTNSVSVGYVALKASVAINELQNRDSLTAIKITTQNLNGEFEPAKGTITITQLETPNRTFRRRIWLKPDKFILSKDEFYKAFPYDAYKDEDRVQNWAKAKQVYSESFDTEQSKALELGKVNWTPGQYYMKLETKDKDGEVIEVEKYFTLYDLDEKKTGINNISSLFLDKNTYQPKDIAKAYFSSVEKELYVLVETQKKQEITSRVWKKVNSLNTTEFDVTEADRGNFFAYFNSVKNNRFYAHNQVIQVPWTNKDLKIEYATFRDKLYPGQEEEWQIKLSGNQKDKVAAEMLAAMYDASLDQFAANHWALNLFPTNNYANMPWSPNGFGVQTGNIISKGWNAIHSFQSRRYPSLHWFGFSFYSNYRTVSAMRSERSGFSKKESREMASAPAPMMEQSKSVEEDAEMEAGANFDQAAGGMANNDSDGTQPPTDKAEQKETDFSDVKVRTNLNETVFFFPNLQTDQDGNILIKFTMNEALTRWKFLGLAHTKDLQFMTTEKSVVTQKDLMVMPNAPRFFREGDEIEFTAKVSNLTDKGMSGQAVLQLFDAVTMEPIDDLLGNTSSEISFNAEGGQSDRLAWTLKIPYGKVNAITHKVIAKAGSFSDGEESSVPVLTNRMLVTETMPLPVRGNESKSFTFKRMQETKSNTLQHHNFTLEFTSNPAWYAVQALPYMMEYPYECTEQIFNRFYSNSLATSVANSHPKVKRVFDAWKGTDAMKSNLSKNQELKSALLEETPWVLNAQSEEQQKRNIGLLFDLNKMSNELNRALTKLEKRQLSNGGFSWFPGGRDSWYITQYLVESMGHLKQLNAFQGKTENRAISMLDKSVEYIDQRIVESYEKLEKRVKKGDTTFEVDHLGYTEIHYLYARSFFLDKQLSGKTQKVFDYYLGQADKYWLDKSQYMQGMIALALQRSERPETPAKIVKSLKERSLNSEEMGMYWKYNTGYWWYQLPIETHALMIEVFDEVAKDVQAVDDLKVWLLKNKQTTHWKTTKATSSAVYALLMSGDNWLLDDQPVEISLGNSRDVKQQIKKAQANAEAGTGYFKTSWKGDDINDDMANIKVNNPNNVVAWGGIYWQYFEDLDKITHFEDTPLKLSKKVFRQESSDTGTKLNPITEQMQLSPGDRLKVRIELRVDRDMEYIHMKDARASGFEPLNVLSTYKWQGGLGYYESTKDASTNFFFDYLPKGTYVFEYPLQVVHKGNFSNGVTTIQSMYAPEFTSHSEGIRIDVAGK